MQKVAVVTGAAGGMGRAIVTRLLGDGMVVVGLDIDAAALAQMEVQTGFTGIEADLMDAAASLPFIQFIIVNIGMDSVI